MKHLSLVKPRSMIMEKHLAHIDQMTDTELAQLLGVTEEQAAALRDFIQHVGGMQNARQAVEMLGRMGKAA